MGVVKARWQMEFWPESIPLGHIDIYLPSYHMYSLIKHTIFLGSHAASPAHEMRRGMVGKTKSNNTFSQSKQ